MRAKYRAGSYSVLRIDLESLTIIVFDSLTQADLKKFLIADLFYAVKTGLSQKVPILCDFCADLAWPWQPPPTGILRVKL